MAAKGNAARHAGFLVLLAIVTLAFAGLIRGFVEPLFWAAVLAIIFNPLQAHFTRWVGGRRSLAAVLTLAAILLIVILPLGLIGLAVSREAIALYQRITNGQVDLPGFVERWRPTVMDLLARAGIDVDAIRRGATDAAGTAVQTIASQAVVFGQNAIRVAIELGLTLYILFFFLRDGAQILAAIVRALPLGDVREHALFERFTSVTRATLKGNLVVGAVQGTLGGLIFWILGINAPVFWGVIMTVLSFLPMLGAALVWAPAAVILIATGSTVRGLVLIVFGALVVGSVDNILRPILVGRETSMPDYMVLLATLGGIAVFGISGFVAGPVIAALFLTVWEMFAQEYAGEGTSLTTP